MSTINAVAIRFEADGREHKCWVGRDAVEEGSREATRQCAGPRV